MNNEFFKERAAHCRVLAEKADPFIKQRLLDLAARYDGGFSHQPKASMMLDLFIEQSKASSPE
jgi:hypothetical protein